MASAISPETGDKQLARVKGIVGYQADDKSAFKPIFGRLDLPDDAYAVTKPNGQAVLRLKDSSEIDIGENTTVQIGQFNDVSTGQPNQIILKNGALHFNIRHPQGGQSNYKFVTATSQIAVRGTEMILVAGAQGTQAVCVSCAAGDVTVQVGNQSISLLSNQTLTVLGNSPLTATTSVTPNSTVNNPAVNQFNGNQNPFNPTPTGNTLDPTSSLSGSGASSAGGGIAGGTAAAAGGGAAAAAAAVAATTSKTSTATPSPTPTLATPGPTPTGTAAATATPTPFVTPTPTPAPTSTPPGALVVQASIPGASSFPLVFSWPFSQTNASTQLTVTCAAVTPQLQVTCTVLQALNGTTLSGTINGNISAAGTFTFSASASGFAVPTTSFTVYGAVTPSATSMNFTSLTPQTITFTQAPAGTILTASYTCAAGAGMSILPTSGPSPLQITVTPISAPTATVATACTLTVNGSGGAAASTTSVPINITTTSIGISSHVRKPL